MAYINKSKGKHLRILEWNDISNNTIHVYKFDQRWKLIEDNREKKILVETVPVFVKKVETYNKPQVITETSDEEDIFNEPDMGQNYQIRTATNYKRPIREQPEQLDIYSDEYDYLDELTDEAFLEIIE